MSMLNDPSMKEIIIDFCVEAEELFDQLEQSLELTEENPANTKELEKFGQIIDRIMGAAKSIGATEIATFSIVAFTSSVGLPPLSSSRISSLWSVQRRVKRDV